MTTIELLSHLRSLGVKLWADGDRLRYNAPKGVLTPELLAQLAASKADVLSFLQKAAANRSAPPPIPAAQRNGAIPLSFAQQRLWFLDRFAPGSPGYNIPTAIRLKGALDIDALTRSLNTIIARHEALRTTFSMIDGQPIQVIAPTLTLTLRTIDLRDLPAAERDAAARREIVIEAQRPFDLERGPLVRASLVQLDADQHIVLFTLHHIITDGWSMGVLIRELATLYAAHAGNLPIALPPLPIQYADYAIWQRGWLQGEVVDQQLAYWKRQLGGDLPVLDLPIARPRPPEQTFAGHTISFMLDPQLSAAIPAFGQREGATLFMALLAGFQVLLHRYTGLSDILVGSPIANRMRTEIEPLIGFFVNTLVLRADLSGNPTVREALRRVRETTLEAYAHQDLPFERLVEELRPERDRSRTPLFQVMFLLQNAGAAQFELPGLTLELEEGYSGVAKFDLLLAFSDTPSGLLAEIEYNVDLFDHDAIARLSEHLQTLLAAMIANPEQPIDDLPLMPGAERALIVETWNATEAADPERTVHALFEAQAARTPDVIALEFPASSAALSGREALRLSYAELNARANRLAHRLRSLGIGPDVRVGVCMDRSPDLVIGILAVLKAGGAYVPLDPAYPAERLQIMLDDSRAPVLLVTAHTAARIDELGRTGFAGHVIDVGAAWPDLADEPADNPRSGAAPENLAYVIYTSGSTGRPKGVAMPHRALANLINWQLHSFAYEGPARTVQYSSPSFDVSFQEIFSTWCAGGTLLIIADDLRRDPAALVQFLDDNAVERLFLPFVALNQLAELIDERGVAPTHLREVTTAGEQLRITEPIARWFERSGSVLHNHYGPSESHVATAYTMDRSPDTWPTLPPVGRQIDNSQIYLLDAQMQPVPIGVPGELYIAGANLARGYLDRPAMTAERFIPNPFVTSTQRWSSRLYKSGDLARWLPDGNIEFLGRADTQVKVRGYRIEPGEIEAVLSQHPDVREAAVVVRLDPSGVKQLAAYVIPAADAAPDDDQPRVNIAELRAWLAQRLPIYMVPAVFMTLDRWPLTPSGKVDRRRLPEPDAARSERDESYLPPRDTVELELTRIWEDLLGVQPIGVRESFFELGGHSLLVVRLMTRIQQQFGQSPPLTSLFQDATVEHLARAIRQDSGPRQHSPLVGLRPSGTRQPFFCVHPGGGNVLCYVELAHRTDAEQPFYALQADGLDDHQTPRTRVEDMAAAYIAALRGVQPEGPYLLGGWSFGGLVAFEMAQQLQAQGQAVALLALIDSWAPIEESDAEPEPDDVSLLAWFANDLGRLFGKRPNVSIDDLRQIDPDQRLQYVLDQARAAEILPPDIDERQIARAVAVFTANMQAMQRYRPQPYAGRVTLLRAVDQPIEEPYDATLGWSRFAADGVGVHDLPGDHYSIVLPPHVEALAERLSAALEAAQSRVTA